MPLFGFIGRLEEQKGVDILFESLPKVLPKADIQVAVLGTGRDQSSAAQTKLLLRCFLEA